MWRPSRCLQVDLYSGTLELAVWLQLGWHDPRLVWDPEEWGGITSKAWGGHSPRAGML